MKNLALQAMLATALLVLNHVHAQNFKGRPLESDQSFAPLARPDTSEVAIEVYKRIGKMTVEPFHKEENSRIANAAVAKSIYAHVIMRSIPDSAQFAQLLAKTGISVISQYPLKRHDKVYEEWIVNTGKLGFAKVYAILTTEFEDHFFNMWVYDADDKWSHKMKGLREFSEKEKADASGMVFGRVEFFVDVAEPRRQELLTQYLQPVEIRGLTYWKGYRSSFQALAHLDEVSRIEEQDTGLYVTNDKARTLLRVSNIQTVPTNVTAPKTNWLDTGIYQNQYYGRGIEVGIYDTGIDRFGAANTTWAGDFWEKDASNIARLRQGNTGIGWINWTLSNPPRDGIDVHGTHVAGIVGGNGWLSLTNGASSRYLWRGIAPKVNFISRGTDVLGFDGHVNNHSHIISTSGEYTSGSAQVDDLVRNHTTTRTMVYAAANNGLKNNMYGDNGYGLQRGYFSILADSKNAITVGASFHDTTLRAAFSSQGPTRDGRIKPDVMAPGSSMEWPNRSVSPMQIEIDSLYFKRQNGTKVKVYNFNALEGWAADYGMASVSVNASILTANLTWVGGWLKNDAVTGYTTNASDSLVIRYRITHAQIPSKMTAIRCGLMWNQVGGLGLDSLRFNLATPGGTTWQTRRFRLSNLRGLDYDGDLGRGKPRWPTANTAITKLGLTFWSDTTEAMYSPSVLDTTQGKKFTPYAHIEGTSMAAPAATGVIALMLEKWRKVFNIADMHTNGPWNSTIKALLIHTATDMVKFAPTPREKGSQPAGQPVNADGDNSVNPDICHMFRDTVADSSGNVIGYKLPQCLAQTAENSWDKYGYGPDYSTGYGLINAEKAMGMIDATKSSRVRQGSIAQNQVHVYTFDVPANTPKFRVSLAWDDLPGDPNQPIWSNKLVNDLDLVIQDPYGELARPYSLNSLPQASSVWNNNTPPSDGIDPVTHADIPTYAPTGENHVDNVEVVDVGNGTGTLTPGKWKIIVKGYLVMSGQYQGYSLVSDFVNRRVNQSIGWIWNHQYYSSTRICPEGQPQIFMDDENTAPNGTGSYFRATSSGTMNPPSDENTTFKNWENTYLRLCREAIDTLPLYRYDYAVFQLSGSCPTNSIPFQVFIDNENTSNFNWNTGDIAPSTQSGGNTTLSFCFVPNNGTTTTPPWWAKKQGAFTTVNSTHNNCPSYNWHVEDDEDANPNNSLILPSTHPAYHERIRALFNWSGNNTPADMHYFWNACP